VLFLDEADMLLGSRQNFAQRAEIAVTAEFLRQLEAFQGIFMCATNFRTSLDPALLRRFGYRLELQALDCEQRRALFCESAMGWGGDPAQPQPPLDAQVAARLDRMDQLTPGAFANVIRRVRSLQLELDACGWLDELQAEQRRGADLALLRARRVEPARSRAGVRRADARSVRPHREVHRRGCVGHPFPDRPSTEVTRPICEDRTFLD
jgi:hypothetical protein